MQIRENLVLLCPFRVHHCAPQGSMPAVTFDMVGTAHRPEAITATVLLGLLTRLSPLEWWGSGAIHQVGEPSA